MGYPERGPKDVNGREYDYIIVGGGTAGCVLASRLTEDPNVSVLVLERGFANETYFSRIPLVSTNILVPNFGAVSWLSEPMNQLENRQSSVFSAEVLGGATRVNGMVYTRGTPADYDNWAALGHPEWSYEKVLPYFVKSEKTLNQPKSAARGDSGPWINQSFRFNTWLYKACQVFHSTAEAFGFPPILDANVPEAPCDGLVNMDSTVNEKHQRMSAVDAFLPKEIALARKNLTVCTGVVVSRLGFSDEQEKPHAEQVFFQAANKKSSETFSVKAKREIILCSGALATPQILMLSGVGPRAHVKEHKIKVVCDLSGVGSNLADHFALPVAWEVPIKESINHVALSPLKGVLEFFKYVFLQTGILSVPVQSHSLFTRSSSLSDDPTSSFITGLPAYQPLSSSKSVENGSSSTTTSNPQNFIPDIEIMPLTVMATDDIQEVKRLISNIGVFTMLVTLTQPLSRGSVRLSSSEPFTRPKIDFGFLSNDSDLVVGRKAVKLAMKLGERMRESGFPLGKGLTVPESDGQEDVDKYIRKWGRPTYHYAGTCRMAKVDEGGVVDDELRVHGVKGLRICDASIFPQIISAHLQAPVVMVAERCADMIKASY